MDCGGVDLHAPTCPTEGHKPDDTSPTEKALCSLLRAGVSGIKEAKRVEKQCGGEQPPSPPLVLPFLPHFAFFTSQECKSLKPVHLRERDLKS